MFSPYETFEIRSLTAFKEIEDKFDDIRTERTIRFLISEDSSISQKIERFIEKTPEYPILCGFWYQDQSIWSSSEAFRKTIRERFFKRDLFNYHSPLEGDVYFFGRTNLVKYLLDRHLSCENSGIFGLRKTGKTSLLNAVGRAAKIAKQPYLQLDCQATHVHLKKWNELIQYIIVESYKLVGLKKNKNLDFSPSEIGNSLRTALLEISGKSNQALLISFDEIENISFGTSPTTHWRVETDSLLFWQTLRSVFQSNKKLFSFVIVGINPKIIETISMANFDNPLFQFVAPTYISGLDHDQSQEMLNKLGSFMGLGFKLYAIVAICDQFGGNPYLIRQVGSQVHNITLQHDRPLSVDKSLSMRGVTAIESNSVVYASGMLDVLEQFYKDEYELLCWLAAGKKIEFAEYIKKQPTAVEHLIGYGIIQKQGDNFDFRVEIFRKALEPRLENRDDLISEKSMFQKVQSERTEIERKLRYLFANIAKSKFGKNAALQEVKKIFRQNRIQVIEKYSYEQIFSIDNSKLYLADFFEIIPFFADEFSNITGLSRQELIKNINTVNKLRRDAHSNAISSIEFREFRIAVDILKRGME